MKQIKLDTIKIENMYGYATAEINFTDGKNVIRNKMRYGKTTILNCVLFALGFAKGKYQPSIEEYIIKDLESRVQMTINVDGLNYCLSVSSKQTWKIKDKETNEKVYIGNSLSYNFDGLECKLADYKTKLSSLFGVPYDKIEMLADIRYFNNDTTKWKWNDRRALIYDLLKVNEQTKVVAEMLEFAPLSEELKKGYSETEIQKSLNAEKKRIADEQMAKSVLLKSKVDEKANLDSIDWTELRAKKESMEKKIAELQSSSSIDETSKRRQKLNEEFYSLRKQVEDIELENHKARIAYENKENSLQREITDIASEYRRAKEQLAQFENQIINIQEELAKAQNSEFPESATKCPTCGRKLNDDEISKAKSNFEKERQVTMERLRKDIATCSESKSQVLEQINDITEKGKAKRAELNNHIVKGYTPKSLKELYAQIDKNTVELDSLHNQPTEKQNVELGVMLAEYSEICSKLSGQEKVKTLGVEIDKLQSDIRLLAKSDADRVRKQNALKDYIIAKAEMASEIINGAFNGIKFRLFKMNGGNAENPIEPTFEVIHEISGYASQSHGQRIYSDICIGIALRKLYGVDMFMFIDEIQSVTETYDYPFQTIELYTTANDTTDIKATKIKDLYTIEDTVK